MTNLCLSLNRFQVLALSAGLTVERIGGEVKIVKMEIFVVTTMLAHIMHLNAGA